MKFYPPEPLTPEERELAQLTAQLGPQGEPSTALDARILAAAHAALDRKQPSRRRKPRWPVAMGLAASVIFAVGIAWQLRPLQQAPVLVSAEAPMPAATAEQEAMTDSAASAPSSASLPEAALADQAAAAAPAPAYEKAAQAPPPPVKNLAPPPEQRALQPRQAVRAATRASEPTGRRAQAIGNVGAGVPPPPPSAPPAPVAMAAAPAPAAEPSVSFAPDPREDYSARGAAADSAASNAGSLAAKPQAEALAEAKAAHANSSARHKESASLDRVEVTGSRMKRTDLQVPVSDDAQLPVNEWLERVRTRYGLGDAGAAKQSLLLFVKDHPSEPVPGDLEPLLEE